MNNAFLLDMSQRIGWTLVHSVWQFALIAMLLALGLRLLRCCYSHVRYGFMLAALCVMAVMPIGMFSVLKSAALPSGEFTASVAVDAPSSAVQQLDLELLTGREPSGAVIGLDSPDGSRRSVNMATDARTVGSILSNITATTHRTIEGWMNGILAVWLFGVLALSIRPLVSWRATRALRSQGRSLVPAQITNTITRVAERLRIRHAIEVTQSTLVNVPTVIGWLRPLVLLPASAILDCRAINWKRSSLTSWLMFVARITWSTCFNG